MKKLKYRKTKRKTLNKKNLWITIASITIVATFTIGYFAITYVNGWTLTDRSIDDSSVTRNTYYGESDVLKFNDPYRHGYCFADISFHRSYETGTFSFYLSVIEKSKLNLSIEFFGSNGTFSKWQNVQDEIEKEDQWYKIDYVYDCSKNSFKTYIDDELLIDGNFTTSSTDNFNRIFIKTNDDGICELYVNIIKLY